MITVGLPGPTGTPIELADWGTPMTQNVNEFVDLLTEPASAWTAYTPAWASTGTAPALGNGTIAGRFMQFGKVGMAEFLLTTGGTTTYGTGTYTFSLPAGWVPVAATGRAINGTARILDVSTGTRYVGTVNIGAGNTVTISTHAAATDLSGTVPVTLASGDSVSAGFTLELA